MTEMPSALSPSHYQNPGKKQAIETMYESMTDEEFAGFCIGNVTKYMYRYKTKNGVEDLKKAKVYIGFLINTLEGRSPLEDK